MVVREREVLEADGTIRAGEQLVNPIMDSAIFDGVPKQVMEGPHWMVPCESTIPEFASFQVAVLDPEGEVCACFAWYAHNGKIDVHYAGRKCKMRLFVQKDLFSQCTMCWKHGHHKGESACKAHKLLCTCCSDTHGAKDHDKSCAKCHGLNRVACHIGKTGRLVSSWLQARTDPKQNQTELQTARQPLDRIFANQSAKMNAEMY
jgi:hypothetical protein